MVSGALTGGGSITTSLSQATSTDLSVSNTSASNGAMAQISAINGGASQIDMVAFGSGSTGTLYGITKANLKVIRDNSLTAQSNGLAIGTDAAVPFYVFTNSVERMRITSAGNVGIGTSSPLTTLSVVGSGPNGILLDQDLASAGASSRLFFKMNTQTYAMLADSNGLNFLSGATAGSSTGSPKMTITSGGEVLMHSTTFSSLNAGQYFGTGGDTYFTTDTSQVLYINRKGNDGTLVDFRRDNSVKGTISVSGETVSYNSFLGSHWSQLQDGSKIEILKGTIIEAIDEMCIWEDETNDRLPKSKISDTLESKNVYGTFLAWDEDWETSNDFYVAAVGLGYIRVNSSQNISMGDLLQSNGDGTAKIQSDDIMRSSTIAKVVSTQKIETYEDGSYLIAATLHCG